MQVVWCDDVKRGELTQPQPPGVADTLAHAQSTAERSRIVASLLHLTGFSTYFALEFAHERVESTAHAAISRRVRHKSRSIHRAQHADRGPAQRPP